MRKVLALLLIFLTAGSLFAFKKGTKGIGGTVSFDGRKNDSSSFESAVTAGYFFFDNICLDLSVGYDASWNKNSSYKKGFEYLDFGISGRYFFKRFYAGLGFFFHNLRNKDSGLKTWEKKLKLSAGYLIGIAKNVFVDVGVAYIKGLGDLKADAPYFEEPFGTTGIYMKNKRSDFQSRLGIVVFFK